MGQPLCVDHAVKVRQLDESVTRQRMAMVNYLKDSAESAIFGAPITTARYDLPVPVLHNGPVTLNNFSFDGSTLGVLNLGQVRSIDVTISAIKDEAPEVAGALSQVTCAVAEARELGAEQRDEVMQGLAFLAEEIRKPAGDRKAGLAKTIAERVGIIVAVAKAAKDAWALAGPLLMELIK